MKNKFLILCSLIFVLVACQKDDEIYLEETNSLSFPKKIEVTKFFAMNAKQMSGDLSDGFKEFGAKNEKEWFIKDTNDNIQYYVIDYKTGILNAVDTFSGYIVNFKKQFENMQNSKREKRAIELCSGKTSSGGTATVRSTYFFTAITITRDDGSRSTSVYPGGYGVGAWLCSGVVISDAIN